MKIKTVKEINYEELKMINKIIDILENNRDFVLSKLKKYTVEEYEKEVEYRKKRSEMMMNALMNSSTRIQCEKPSYRKLLKTIENTHFFAERFFCI